MDSNPTQRQLTRRGALRLATSALGLAGLGMPFISRARAAEPIRIGLSVAQASPEARHVRFGVEWALRQHGARLLGQPVQLLIIDEVDGATLRSASRGLIEDQQVAAIIGGSSAEAGMALKAVANDANIPVIIHSAIADDITLRDPSRWVFRVPAPAMVQFLALCPYVADIGKRWFVLTELDRVGQSQDALSSTMMWEAAATEAGRAMIDPGTADLRPLIEAIRQAKPDAVMSALQGGESRRFLKAWHAAGMKERMPYAQIGLSDIDLWSLGGQMATGIYVKTYHYKNIKNPPFTKEFIAAFGRQYNGEAPASAAFQAQAAMESLLVAIDRSGGTEAERIRGGLEQFSQVFGDVTLRYRLGDHQMMHRLPILETKTIIRTRYDFWDIEAHTPENASELDAFYSGAMRRSSRPRAM